MSSSVNSKPYRSALDSILDGVSLFGKGTKPYQPHMLVTTTQTIN